MSALRLSNACVRHKITSWKKHLIILETKKSCKLVGNFFLRGTNIHKNLLRLKQTAAKHTLIDIWWSNYTLTQNLYVVAIPLIDESVSQFILSLKWNLNRKTMTESRCFLYHCSAFVLKNFRSQTIFSQTKKCVTGKNCCSVTLL